MMIDTGSPFTVISPKDLLRFRIPLKKYTRIPGQSVKIAGFSFKRHEMGDIKITLRTENKTPITIESSLFSMMTPTTWSKKIQKDIQAIPSILGNDFLEEHEAAIYFDPSTKTAYLELKNIADPDA